MGMAAFFSMVPKAQAQYAGHVSTLVMDAASGRVLSETDADLQRYPASLTKMMTLYLTFRAIDEGRLSLDQRIAITPHAASMEPSKLGLRPGSTLTVYEAVMALVTKSANDAACALGEYLGNGSEPRFANAMSDQARALGMRNTTFRNASGLPNPDQVTTARDLAILARHLIKDFPQFYPYFSAKEFYFRGRMLPNHDTLLRLYAGADGLKTGYTGAAGHNLVSSAVQGQSRLIGVVMGASSNNIRNLIMMDQLDNGFTAMGQTPYARPTYVAPRRSPLLYVHYHRSRPQHSTLRMATWRHYTHHLTFSSHAAHATHAKHGKAHAVLHKRHH
ncbi:D-alanyl-D-alanine carboxypeptidase [Formicincola oecophyllae]|uniref:D-alanyl-D-alanine carboxypeptidase n=1 Tax=Formicincola oecophyllae TaxID=2558361 RepID=A0A4Y6UAA0_9PROT|nr:D-alanyl-D-alanine carboxypeptidase family protein [Formicincola oecophyllae]QDH14393.1 D-alanyl-D-alanine carboxypeptidase [Formicincola oecophyllae]